MFDKYIKNFHNIECIQSYFPDIDDKKLNEYILERYKIKSDIIYDGMNMLNHIENIFRKYYNNTDNFKTDYKFYQTNTNSIYCYENLINNKLNNKLNSKCDKKIIEFNNKNQKLCKN